jgi:DNA-binding GntR family transcriptional regulator
MARAPRAASVVTTLPVAELAPARAGHRRSSGDLVADHIRRLIFEGRLRQGDHLRQDEIALELGVSRIPVREAVIALDREGWLMIEPHRGAFVHGLDEDAVRDHYEVFGLIYGLTARRATERGSAENKAELAEAQREAKRADDVDTFFRANNDFLRQLFAMANSQRLASLSRLLRNIVPGNFFEAVPGAMVNQKRGITAIAKAVRAGDGELAERECLTLMRRQGDAVVSLLAARQLFRPSA